MENNSVIVYLVYVAVIFIVIVHMSKGYSMCSLSSERLTANKTLPFVPHTMRWIDNLLHNFAHIKISKYVSFSIINNCSGVVP